jgi:hypothetical protein
MSTTHNKKHTFAEHCDNRILIIIIIIKLPNQAIASTPSAPRPTGAAEREPHPQLRNHHHVLMPLAHSKLYGLTTLRKHMASQHHLASADT